MRVTIAIQMDTELYYLEEARQAEQFAKENDQAIYCWKALGRSNWLERGLSIFDVLGVVVLPKGLPELIEMPDDHEIDSDKEMPSVS